jgi:hypothetical protein
MISSESKDNDLDCWKVVGSCHVEQTLDFSKLEGRIKSPSLPLPEEQANMADLLLNPITLTFLLVLFVSASFTFTTIVLWIVIAYFKSNLRATYFEHRDQTLTRINYTQNEVPVLLGFFHPYWSVWAIVEDWSLIDTDLTGQFSIATLVAAANECYGPPFEMYNGFSLM